MQLETVNPESVEASLEDSLSQVIELVQRIERDIEAHAGGLDSPDFNVVAADLHHAQDVLASVMRQTLEHWIGQLQNGPVLRETALEKLEQFKAAAHQLRDSCQRVQERISAQCAVPVLN